MNVIEEMNFFKKHDVELHINDLKNEGLGALASIMTTFQVTNAHIDYADTVKKMLKGKKDRVILHKKAHTGRRFSLFGYDYISKRRNFYYFSLTPLFLLEKLFFEEILNQH